MPSIKEMGEGKTRVHTNLTVRLIKLEGLTKKQTQRMYEMDQDHIKAGVFYQGIISGPCFRQFMIDNTVADAYLLKLGLDPKHQKWS